MREAKHDYGAILGKVACIFSGRLKADCEQSSQHPSILAGELLALSRTALKLLGEHGPGLAQQAEVAVEYLSLDEQLIISVCSYTGACLPRAAELVSHSARCLSPATQMFVSQKVIINGANLAAVAFAACLYVGWLCTSQMCQVELVPELLP